MIDPVFYFPFYEGRRMVVYVHSTGVVIMCLYLFKVNKDGEKLNDKGIITVSDLNTVRTVSTILILSFFDF